MADQASKAHEDYLIYRYCRDNGHDEFIKRAHVCTDFYFNRQWTDQELAKLRERNMPAVTVNRIFRTVDSTVGLFLDNRIDVRHIPAKDGRPEIADALDKVYLSVAARNKLDYLDMEVFERGIMVSRSYWDVRVEFDDNMMGHVTIDQLRPQNVVLDPEIDAADPKKWPQVFTTNWNSLLEIEATYGKDAANELKSQPISSWLSPEDLIAQREFSRRYSKNFNTDDGDPNLIRGYRLIERQYREMKVKQMFVDMETGDMSEVPESWDRNKIANVLAQFPNLNTIKKRVPTIRWRVTASNLVLHDADSPYRCFTVVPFFPYFIDGETMGQVENLLDTQRLYNKAMSQELHIINTSANSGWQVEEDQLVNMEPEELESRGAETGLVIVRRKGTNPLEKIQPNPVPSGHENFSNKMEVVMKEISGIPDAAIGFASQYESGKAQGQKKLSTVINMSRAMQSFYNSKRMVAERIRDCVQAFYTEERLLKITGGGLQPVTSEIVINQMTPEGTLINDVSIGEYEINIVPTPARVNAQETLMDQLIQLRGELGVNIPDDVLIENSLLPRKMEVLARIKELTGTGEPTEQQIRKQEAELRLMEGEAEKLFAEIESMRASAKLDDARAEKSYADAEGRRIEAARDPESQRLAYEAERDAAALEEQRQERIDNNALELTKLEKQYEMKMQEIAAKKEDMAKKWVEKEKTPKTSTQPAKKGIRK